MEYHVLFDKCSTKLPDIPGRCLVQNSGDFYPCQTFLAFNGEKEIDRAREIRAYMAAFAEKYADLHARRIPAIPEILYAHEIAAVDPTFLLDKGQVAVGLDYKNVKPFVIDLKSLGCFAVTGKSHFGQKNFLRYLVSSTAQHKPNEFVFFIVDGIDRKLSDLADLPNVASYEFLPDKAPEIIRMVESKVSDRYEAILRGDPDLLSSAPTIVLMINNADAIELLCNTPAALASYNNIIGRFKSMNVCVVLGDFPNTNIPYSAPEILKKVKDERKFFFFDDFENFKVFDLPYSVTKQYKKMLELGDCYFFSGNDSYKLKTPKLGGINRDKS